MHQCPECGHRWRDEARASGGKARWKGVSKKKRSEAARLASLAMGAKARSESNSKAAKIRWLRFRETRTSTAEDGKVDAQAQNEDLD